MAVRSRLQHDDLTRKKIQSTQIVNRLNKHVLSEDGDIMTTSQVNAAKVLLNKVIPDLSNIDMAGQVDSTLTITRKEYKPSS
jgi:hypothetical protein